MKSPLVQGILSILIGYLVILLGLIIYDWISKEYPRRPNKPPSIERIQHPIYHEAGVKALRLYLKLSKREKTAIQENLKSNLVSLEKYLNRLGRSKFQILCMGELHEESTRDFLAEEFFSNVSADALLLEATPKKMKHLIKRMDAGKEYFPLLDADIMNILRSAKERNPDIKIWGVEETDEQQKRPLGHLNSRDQNIAQNFWDRFQPGKRHIILFGAFHCTNESNWLFNNLYGRASLLLKERMLNVQVLEEHQNGPLEAFIYFLDEIGIEKRDFVISSTNSLHPFIYDHFQLLNQNILAKYRTLIVFRSLII